MVRELLADGAFGADMSASFTFTPNGNFLEISETGEVLTHRTWYGVTSDGWEGVAGFATHNVLQVGDSNNDGRVTNGDSSDINTGVPTFNTGPLERRDINGDGRITNGDASAANANILSLPVTKPTGHTCP
jgi:hypothetical protein